MRILHITSHLNVGGVSSSILALSRGLIERGDQVMIASGGGQCEPQAKAVGASHWRVPLHTSAEFSPKVFAAIATLTSRLRKEPVDLLHGHTRVGQLAACRLARRLRLPYVTTWHGFFRPNLGRKIWPCTGDATIAISDPVRRHLRETFHVPEERVHLVAHGIDPAPFEAPADLSEQASLRRATGLDGGGPVIGTVARLVPSKGVDWLIRSLPRIREAAPDARLLIVGDGPERDALGKLAKEQQVLGAVHFAGALPQTRVALSLMDVFVFLPADKEGFGLVLLEAMASARPIVAVRRGLGASWVLEESGVGTLVEPEDAPGLSTAITALLRDPSSARWAGERGRAVVRQRYTHSRMVDQVRRVYEAACRAHPAEHAPVA